MSRSIYSKYINPPLPVEETRMAPPGDLDPIITAKDKQIAELRIANEKLTQKIKLLKLTAMQALEPIDLMVMSPAEERLYEMVRAFN